jgi:hypothetical protein
MNKGTNQKFTFDEVFQSEPNCAQSERVQLYFQGLLSEAEKQGMEKHLHSCAHCASFLADLEESETAISNVVLDAKKADKIFKQNRKRINERLDQRYPTAIPEKPFWTMFQIPAYVTVLAVVLMSLMIYPAYRSLVLTGKVDKLERQLELAKQQPTNLGPYQQQIQALHEERDRLLQPELAVSSIHPVRMERAPDDQLIDVIFSDAARTFSVVLSLPAGDFEHYRLDISKQNDVLWRRELPALHGTSLVSIQLRAGYFKPGSYKLHVYGKIGERENAISQFQLRIQHR